MLAVVIFIDSILSASPRGRCRGQGEAVEGPVPRLLHSLGEDKTQTLTAAKQDVGRRQQGPCDGSWAGCGATLGSNPNSASG